MKWEVKGDRVRYLSAERFEWEEVPGSLVDWDATNKYAEDLKKGVSHSATDVDKEVEAERKEMDARSPEVAPGLRLPDTGGVFLFERFAQTFRNWWNLRRTEATSTEIPVQTFCARP